MAVTRTQLKQISDEITANVESTESGTGYIYFGTNKGEVWKYNILTEALTLLGNVGDAVFSMSIYSGAVWCGCAGGKLVKLTTS